MTSRPRLESATGIHHVMNRGTDHQPIFFGEADRLEFGRRLAAIHDRHDVRTLAYALMDTHFHLLLHAPPDTLSEAVQHLSSLYTLHTNDRVGRDGPLLRGVFRSIPVETDTYLRWVTRYIHRNPLDISGVDSPLGYRWSSYPVYAGRRAAPAFLDVAPVLALFDGRREALVAFTEDGGVDVQPSGTGIETTADLRLLIECGIAADDLTRSPEPVFRQHLERTVTILVADRSQDPALRRALGAALDASSPEAASAARRRARRRYDDDPMVRRIVAWVEAELVRASRRGFLAG